MSRDNREESQSPQLGDLLSRARSVLDTQKDVRFAYLYGSFAKGRPRGSSDVDVAVWLHAVAGDPANKERRLERRLELEAVLERELRLPASVIALNDAPVELAHNVLQHGRIILSRDESARTRFYVDHARTYYDMAHARQIFSRYMRRRIEEGTFGGGAGNRS